MKALILTISIITASLVMAQSSIHDFSFETIDGKQQSFADYKGKKILIFNAASKCGYTGQYEDLQKLHDQYKDKLVVIGFPANEFGKQEPGTNDEIATFCKKNYGVTFQMAAKVVVKGDDINPLFKWLTTQPNPDFTGDIKWNFEKFLLNEDGTLINRYRSGKKPLSEDITSKL
jgi:glutathione peroxidase